LRKAFIVFLISSCFAGVSQNQLFERYNDSANANKKVNYVRAKRFTDSALAVAIQANTHELLARAYNTMGVVDESSGRYTSAIEYYTEAEKHALLLTDKTILAKVYNNQGISLERLGDFHKSLAKHFKALAIREKLPDKKELAVSHQNIAVTYYNLGNTPELISHSIKAIKIAENLKDYKFLGELYSNLGVGYFNTYQDSLALKSYRMGLKYSTQANDAASMASAYINIGNFYMDLGYPGKAMQALKNSLSIKDLSHSEKHIDINNNLASVFEKLNRPDSAIHYYNIALKQAQASNYKPKILDVYRNLRLFYFRKNDFKKSYEYLDKYLLLKEEMLNEKNLKNIAELETVYKTEQQAQKIALLNSANEMEQQKTKSSRLLLIISLICLLCVCFAAISFYRNFKNKKRDNLLLMDKNKQIEEQKEALAGKNKEILDSITYAKRLQQAILPPQHYIDRYFPDNFVLYKPKDIVAGDFYWMHVSGDMRYIAAADSTGHGVPGAMVSIVCSNALDKAVKEFKLTDTGKILDKTRELVLETFEKSRSDVKDGMDISLLCWDAKNSKIYWSGANNRLCYISPFEGVGRSMGNVALAEIKADKQPIGKVDVQEPFRTHEIEYKAGTVFYLITDGFADQFGGDNGKKFKYKHLQEVLLESSERTMEQQHNRLNEVFEKWKGGLEQIDDVTIIGIRI
jgi:tetratricopeptide (TPR) repeat protein